MPQNRRRSTYTWPVISNLDEATTRHIRDLYNTEYSLELKDEQSSDKIKTIDGQLLDKEECIYIERFGWFSKKDRRLCRDYFDDTLILRDYSKPIYPYFLDNGDLDYSREYYYNPNKKHSGIAYLQVKDGMLRYTNYRNIPQEFYTEDFTDGYYKHKSLGKICTKKKLKIKARKADCVFKSKGNLLEDYKMGVKSPSFIKTEGKQYKYGLEIETISGLLPHRVDSELNYMSLRDGSLKDDDGNEYGFEYVTGVLTGDMGLLQLKKLCNILEERCIVNKKCGIHTHIGNVIFTKELIVFLYKLYLKLEDDFFKMVPLSRRNNEYCRRLKKFDFKFTDSDLNNVNKYKSLIDKYYNEIYQYISNSPDLPSTQFNKKTQHPLGAKCGYNHKTARYCWINFVPTLFDTRGNGSYTIENRLMQGSTNFTKIKNWLLINMGVVWFAENCKKEIALNDNLTLKEVIEKAFPKNHINLNTFIDKRVEKFSPLDEEINLKVELEDYTEESENKDLKILTI